uniref:Uncharacterized protein n=1 Tax=Arundo donax TaxID=35708 RepID=A0A0A8ZLU1_ARUDO
MCHSTTIISEVLSTQGRFHIRMYRHYFLSNKNRSFYSSL